MLRFASLEANGCSVGKILPVLHGTGRLIFVFTGACHWILSYARLIQLIYSFKIHSNAIPSGLFRFYKQDDAKISIQP
jgi:hypothetical protein